MTEAIEVSVDQFITNHFVKIYSKMHIGEIIQIVINHGYEVDDTNTQLIKKYEMHGFIIYLLDQNNLKRENNFRCENKN